MTLFHSLTADWPKSRPASSSPLSARTRRHRYARFSLMLLGFIAAPMVGVAAINGVVDPYGVFNWVRRSGFNQVKPNQDNNDRLFKAVDVIRIQPEVVLLGSSRTKQGLNPDHAVLQTYSENRYNLGLNGVNAYEQLRYFEHLLANQPNPALVILGVDFFMFNTDLANQPSFAEHRLERSHLTVQDAVNITFSLDALMASRDTVRASRASDRPVIDSGNGFMPNHQADNGETLWRFGQSIRLYFERHSNYSLSEEHFSAFERVVELADEQEIPLVIFISPAHATQWEAIRATGRWQTFEDWKRRLVAVAPVWDFSGYNSVTTEMMADHMAYYTDNSHYTEIVGNWMLIQMLASETAPKTAPKTADIPADFGKLLTPENVDEHLAQIRADRERWAIENPDVVDWVLEKQAGQSQVN